MLIGLSFLIAACASSGLLDDRADSLQLRGIYGPPASGLVEEVACLADRRQTETSTDALVIQPCTAMEAELQPLAIDLTTELEDTTTALAHAKADIRGLEDQLQILTSTTAAGLLPLPPVLPPEPSPWPWIGGGACAGAGLATVLVGSLAERPAAAVTGGVLVVGCAAWLALRAL